MDFKLIINKFNSSAHCAVYIFQVIPVGDYYKGGLSKTVHSVIVEGYDRAAKYGVGAVKVAGK